MKRGQIVSNTLWAMTCCETMYTSNDKKVVSLKLEAFSLTVNISPNSLSTTFFVIACTTFKLFECSKKNATNQTKCINFPSRKLSKMHIYLQKNVDISLQTLEITAKITWTWDSCKTRVKKLKKFLHTWELDSVPALSQAILRHTGVVGDGLQGLW